MSSPSSKPSPLNLSPSAASRWLACKGSPGFIAAHADELPQESSEWADEGTQAHAVAANLLNNQPVADAPLEMLSYAKSYAEFVREHLDGGALIVEQKVPLFYMAGRNGQIDAGIVNPKGIFIGDLKYGAGISVEAQNNPQLGIYGLSFVRWLEQSGLYDQFPGDTLVTLAIYQPRARDKRVVRLWALRLFELVEFCATIGETAAAIQADPDNQPFAPSDDVCRFCPAASICSHRTQSLLKDLPPAVTEPIKAVIELPDIGTLSPEQVGKIIAAAGPLKKFLDDVREHGYKMAVNGLTVPGCKLVAGRSSRKWVNEEEAERILRQKFPIDAVMPRSLLSVAQTEKLLKSIEVGTRFTNLLEANITKPEGAPTLVSEDDPRPALDSNPVSELTNLDSQDTLLH